MRITYRPEFVEDETGCVGFYFDNGGCAEHERGIKTLANDFGMDSTILGMDGRKVTVLPGGLHFITYTINKIKRAFLMYSKYSDLGNLTELKEIKKYVQGQWELQTKPWRDETEWVSAAYSDSDFAIYAAGKDNVEKLEKLYNALLEKDMVMFMGIPQNLANNPFASGGLIFLMYSRLSDEYKEDVYQSDKDEKELNDIAAPIKALLKEKKKNFFCCSPEWIDEEKTKVRYFLNPWNQKDEYYGWVTEQDLRDWAENKGVIPGHGDIFRKEHPEEYEELYSKIKNSVGLH